MSNAKHPPNADREEFCIAVWVDYAALQVPVDSVIGDLPEADKISITLKWAEIETLAKFDGVEAYHVLNSIPKDSSPALLARINNYGICIDNRKKPRGGPYLPRQYLAATI
ncbi:MAG: hypothetical protein ABTQ34_06695 [Bdellovibrionales bacterium]